jgi:prepilin-type processing-associated H-X9-DG protein
VVTSFSSITDGSSNTIAASEIIVAGLAGSKANCVNGTSNPAGNQYSNFTLAQVNAWGQAGLNNLAQGGLNNEGHRWHAGGTGRTSFNTLLTPNSNYPDVTANCGTGSSCDNNATSMVAARSYHTGGVHVLMGDGSVRFASNNIDWLTWTYLGNRSDGQVVSAF